MSLVPAPVLKAFIFRLTPQPSACYGPIPVDDAPIQDFIARWQNSGAAERANYALFLSELCDLLGVPRPDPTQSDDSDNAYVFERSVTFHHQDGTTKPSEPNSPPSAPPRPRRPSPPVSKAPAPTASETSSKPSHPSAKRAPSPTAPSSRSK